MNFLAHSLLGFDDPQLISGQFCGDFVRGSDLSGFPRRVETGIRLHRHLDKFTDSHEALVAQRQAITIIPRRYTGIVVDVLFDHYLALDWRRHSELTLDGHAAQVHAALQQHQQILPEPLKRFMGVLQSERILQNNVHLASIATTLERLSRRSVHFAPLALSTQQLAPLFSGLTETFGEFYPELHQAALHYISTNPETAGSQ